MTATKKVRFNDKVQVFLIPRKNLGDCSTRFNRPSASTWVQFSQTKPLSRRLTVSGSTPSFQEAIRGRHVQEPLASSVDCGWKRLAERYVLPSPNACHTEPKRAQGLHVPRDLDSVRGHDGHFSYQAMPKTPFVHEKRFWTKPNLALSKSATNRSAKFHPIILENRGYHHRRGEGPVSEILAVYGNNPRLATAKAGFSSEISHTTPEAIGDVESKQTCASFGFFPNIKRPAPVVLDHRSRWQSF